MINEVIQIFYDQFVLVQIIQSSPIPQISNLLKTFLEAEYFEVVLIVFTVVLATVQGRQSSFFSWPGRHSGNHFTDASPLPVPFSIFQNSASCRVKLKEYMRTLINTTQHARTL